MRTFRRPSPAACTAALLAFVAVGCCATPPVASDHFDLRSPAVTVRGFVYAAKFDDPEHAGRCARTDDGSRIAEWVDLARTATFEPACEVEWIPADGASDDRGLVLVPRGDAWIAFSVVATRFVFDELRNEWRPVRPNERALYDAAAPGDAETDWKIVDVAIVERPTEASFFDPDAAPDGGIES